MSLFNKTIFALIILVLTLTSFSPRSLGASYIKKHKAATSLQVVNYARNLLLSIVDSSFRGSWVIDPENQAKVEETTKKLQKTFETLSKVKIGSTSRDVRKVLNNPTDVKNNGKIWIYGIKKDDGTYEELLEVFFNDKECVIGIITFNSKSIVENIGVDIGDPIDKMIAIYGEPVDEKDFIEDPDNKDYLGLYYLYPRSGIGFLIGQDKVTSNLLVQGVLVFGNK